MELKLRGYSPVVNFRYLLIVPYGIEIGRNYRNKLQVNILLIVPYGIEIPKVE